MRLSIYYGGLLLGFACAIWYLLYGFAIRIRTSHYHKLSEFSDSFFVFYACSWCTDASHRVTLSCIGHYASICPCTTTSPATLGAPLVMSLIPFMLPIAHLLHAVEQILWWFIARLRLRYMVFAPWLKPFESAPPTP
jgi:hypothetical protein